MGSKNISIGEKAYRRLRQLRKTNKESFTDVIMRVTSSSPRALDGIVGAWSEHTAKKIMKGIMEDRRKHRVAKTRRLRRLGLS